MSIQQFYNTAAKHDFARQFQFKLEFLGELDFSEKQLVYIETASLPGRTITNVPVPYMGLSFNVPGTATYPGSAGYQITFRCDEKYDIRSALEAMTFKTFDEATSTGSYRMPADDSKIIMTLLDKQMQPVRGYTLFGAYVQALGDSQYDIKDTGTVVQVPVTIAYQFWRAGTNETTGVAVSSPADPVPNINGLAPWR
jgi:hypothetical protein